MNNYQSLVLTFQRGAKVLDPLPTVPTPLTPAGVALWHRLISEEHNELLAALASGNIVDTVHEQCDLLYVLYGAACWQGLRIPRYATSAPFIQRQEWVTLLGAVLEYLLARQGKLTVKYQLALQDALGLLHTNPPYGVSLWPAFQAVHAANMAKLGGTVIAGKLTKPEGWQPADVATVLRRQGLAV
jgi:hypothetical protein